MKRNAMIGAIAALPWLVACGSAGAQPIIVTAPGGAVDADDAQSVTADDIDRAGTPDLLQALARNVAGVTLQDAQNNPWQPNLVYRGFIASPLQGQAQGLAAYLDGARFNQPFGDTVSFDLIPEAAIRSLTLLDASPIYGLNALGGAIVLETKTGHSDPGIDASFTGGRFGYREAVASGGFTSGDVSAFAAIQYSKDGGWRDFSPSRLYNGYADLGFDTAGGGLHVKVVGADSNLTGNGVSPVELLAARRQSVFTHPDNTRNRYGRVSLHPWLALSETTRIEASLYGQSLKTRTVNGDAADIEECGDIEGILCLESADEEAPLVDAAGAQIADTLGGEGYGVLNRSRTSTWAVGALAQIIDTRPLFGGENYLSIGTSYDASRTRFDTSTELGALTDDRSVEGLGNRIVQPDGAIAPVGLVAHTRYWGAFIQDRLPLGPRLSAELGLRYNHARIVLQDQIGTALNGKHSFQRLNPGIELDYRVSDAASLRIGYAQSNRAPTPAELSCADENAPCSLTNFFVADPPLKQVVAKSWEAGALGTMRQGGWKIDWLLSAYRTVNANDIQYIASQVRGRAYFQNVGDTRRQGIEASLTATQGGLSAHLSYAYTDGTFRTAHVRTSPANPLADEDGTIAIMRGDTLPGIPRHSATVSLDYSGALAGKRKWSVGVDIMGRSGQYLVGDESNLTPKTPGYILANIRAGLDVLRGVTLFGEVRNVFNRRYATFGTFSDVSEIALTEAPDASDPRAYGPGAPRRWYAGIKAKF